MTNRVIIMNSLWLIEPVMQLTNYESETDTNS